MLDDFSVATQTSNVGRELLQPTLESKATTHFFENTFFLVLLFDLHRVFPCLFFEKIFEAGRPHLIQSTSFCLKFFKMQLIPKNLQFLEVGVF